jgi:hypothetical protein
MTGDGDLLLAALALTAAAPADLELQATVHADRVTIVKQGKASASVRASPDGGSKVTVQAPKANGRKTINNVAVDVRIAVRLAGAADTIVQESPPAGP